MRMKGLAAVAAVSLIAAPVTAATPSAAAPSLGAQRVGDATQGSNELVGTTAWILAAIALGLIVWGIIELTGDDDAPSSP